MFTEPSLQEDSVTNLRKKWESMLFPRKNPIQSGIQTAWDWHSGTDSRYYVRAYAR